MSVILSGDWPWPTDHVQAILDCDYDFDSEIWDEISSDAKDLIGSLLLRDPDERLTAMIVIHKSVSEPQQTGPHA
jgi:serine/threonine protein kinase